MRYLLCFMLFVMPKAYQSAKLTDVRSDPTGGGGARAQFSYCLAFDLANRAC